MHELSFSTSRGSFIDHHPWNAMEEQVHRKKITQPGQPKGQDMRILLPLVSEHSDQQVGGGISVLFILFTRKGEFNTGDAVLVDDPGQPGVGLLVGIEVSLISL